MTKKILHLIRWKNLIFIALIQILMRYFIMLPILKKISLNLLFSDFYFFLLVLVSLLFAAGGNMINDYFDVDLDKQAGKTNYVTKENKNKIMNWFIGINIVALIISFYISFQVGYYKLGFIFVIISSLLWFYSSNYQRSLLIGNIIIALLAFLVPLITIPFEILLQYTFNKDILIRLGNNLNTINFWILGFSIYAFVLTFIREIIKDMEDYDTDIMFNYNTLPIVLGLKKSNIVVNTLLSLTILSIIFVTFTYLNNILSIIYITTLVILPLIFLIFKISKAQNTKDYHFASILSKLIMLSGVLYSIVTSFKF